jgi:hypothetical protein
MLDDNLVKKPDFYRNRAGGTRRDSLATLGGINSSVIPIISVKEFTGDQIERVTVEQPGLSGYPLIKLTHNEGRIAPYFMRARQPLGDTYVWWCIAGNNNIIDLSASGFLSSQYIQLIEYTDQYLLFDFYNAPLFDTIQIFFLNMSV